MGAWGAGGFENDDALDFLAELEEEEDLGLIREAFVTVIENDDYIDVDDASIAVAAGEVVALMLGNATTSLPDELIAWHAANDLRVPGGLAKRALRALEKVKADSELRDLWEESDDFADWQANIDDLVARIVDGM